MKFSGRIHAAVKAACIHLIASLCVAIVAAYIVLGCWYPYPYRELSGGRELFLILVCVDVICGPMLTFVLFNPAKRTRELRADLALVVLVQLVALGYGVWTSWQARPLYLVLEVDRFKVVMSADIDHKALQTISSELQPLAWGGVRVVAVRKPISAAERNAVLFEAIEGGRDYAERPEFYTPYTGAAALESLARAKPLMSFFEKYPDQRLIAEKIAKERQADLNSWKLLPVVGRQDWVALLDQAGQIQGFVKGDGF